MNFLDKYITNSYSLMRIIAGFMFSFHGIEKLFGIVSTSHSPIFSELWFAGVAELLFGLCIMIGFQTRFSAFLSSGIMAVAYDEFHWKSQFNLNALPIVNKGELELLYCFVFFFIACQGAGIWSLDQWLKNKKAKQKLASTPEALELFEDIDIPID